MDDEQNVKAGDLKAMVALLGSRLMEGVVSGFERSEMLSQVVDLLEELTLRVEQVEHQFTDESLKNRVQALERELGDLKAGLAPRAAEKVELALPPRAVQPPPAAANLPKATAMSNLPFGLSAVPANRTTRRPRSRTQVRPTVIYRTDPRTVAKQPAAKQAPAKEATAKLPPPEAVRVESALSPEPDTSEANSEQDRVCSEPGCERAVRCRNLCALHYQRLRYKERKIENKQANDDPMPPPPPPKRRPANKEQKSGGTKGVFAVLYDEKGRRTLAGLINQMKFNRLDLVERLNTQFAGMPGVPLEEEDVLRVVHYHQLGEALHKREGEILCRHLSKQRGSMVKTAQKMKMPTDQLQGRIDELGLVDQVAQVRNEHREKILEGLSFSERLELALTREKYLKDLGIEAELDESLKAEIEIQLTRLGAETDMAEAEAAIQEALALDEQGYRRMVRRYDLEQRLHSLFGLEAEEA